MTKNANKYLKLNYSKQASKPGKLVANESDIFIHNFYYPSTQEWASTQARQKNITITIRSDTLKKDDYIRGEVIILIFQARSCH